jgi:hypothetical protein
LLAVALNMRANPSGVTNESKTMKAKDTSREVDRLRMSIEFSEQSDPPTPDAALRRRCGRNGSDGKGPIKGRRDRDIASAEAWLGKVIRKELGRALHQAERELKGKLAITVPVSTALVLRRALQIRASSCSRRRK